jgi:hypothetical protein
MEALDARIGEQDIDAAEFLFAPRGGRSERRQIALVELDGKPSSVGRPDKPPGFRQIRGGRRLNAGTRVDNPTDIDANDVCALAGEGDGGGAANPASGAGDRGHLASQGIIGSSYRTGHCLLRAIIAHGDLLSV